MIEDQFVKIILTHVKQQFPKTCNACGRRFSSLKEYLQNTVHVGKPHCYDAEMEDWQPHSPLGTFSFSNCKCGSTMVVGTSGMGVVTAWRLLWWIRGEKFRRKISVNELLNDLRIKVDNQILNEEKSFQKVTESP